MTGKEAAQLRKDAGHTAAALAKLLGTSEATVSRWENAREVPGKWAEALQRLPPATPAEGTRGPYLSKAKGSRGRKATAQPRQAREKPTGRAPIRASEEPQPEADVVPANKEAEREQVLAVVREEVVLRLLEADVERAFELLQAEDFTKHATHLPPPLPAPRAPERCPVCQR